MLVLKILATVTQAIFFLAATACIGGKNGKSLTVASYFLIAGVVFSLFAIWG